VNTLNVVFDALLKPANSRTFLASLYHNWINPNRDNNTAVNGIYTYKSSDILTYSINHGDDVTIQAKIAAAGLYCATAFLKGVTIIANTKLDGTTPEAIQSTYKSFIDNTYIDVKDAIIEITRTAYGAADNPYTSKKGNFDKIIAFLFEQAGGDQAGGARYTRRKHRRLLRRTLKNIGI
jgi:hypothetical protein